MRIPQTFIDELLTRTDIVEVIDKHVPLKKAGKEYMACCPFHNEKTPSFTVSPQKQFYHCFGCGAHGTAIGFLMDYERMEFVEAVEELASMLGLSVPHEQGAEPAQDHDSPRILEILDKADQYFQQQLREHPAAQKAVDYLKQRGLSGELAKRFGLGFAPPGWHNLCEHYQDPQTRRQLLAAGLIVARQDDDFYDRFRNRIMFPIRNRRGRVVGFGGRVLEPGDNPKYLNSPETPVFHKGRELYGLYEAREALRRPQRLLVVEGYMDVIALAQFDIPYAVATLGTATSTDHLRALFRLVKEVVFCFDGDAAGRRAAAKALETALPVIEDGWQISFLFLPEGQDPDSLVRTEGRQRFEARIAEAMPLSEYMLRSIAGQIDIRSVDGKARYIATIRPLLNKLRAGVFRDLLVGKTAEFLQVPAATLEQGLDKPTDREKPVSAPSPDHRPIKKTPVRHAITLLLHHPEFAQKIDNIDALREIDLPGIKLFIELLETLQSNPNLNIGALLERWRDKENAKHLLTLAKQALPGEKQGLSAEFSDVVKNLMAVKHEQRWNLLHRKLAQEGLSQAEKLEYQQLLDVMSQQNT